MKKKIGGRTVTTRSSVPGFTLSGPHQSLWNKSTFVNSPTWNTGTVILAQRSVSPWVTQGRRRECNTWSLFLLYAKRWAVEENFPPTFWQAQDKQRCAEWLKIIQATCKWVGTEPRRRENKTPTGHLGGENTARSLAVGQLCEVGWRRERPRRAMALWVLNRAFFNGKMKHYHAPKLMQTSI